MDFSYEIDPKLGGSDQIGLRLKCVSMLQAEEIHRTLRQEGIKISQLFRSTHRGFTHFTYVTASESELQAVMPRIYNTCGANNTRVVADRLQQGARTAQMFRDWQNQFRRAVQRLNSDPQQLVSSVQEKNLDLHSEGVYTTEIEQRLLEGVTRNDSNSLRALIALYANNNQYEQLVELCKAKRSEVLALPVSGRLVEQLIAAHFQHHRQTGQYDSLQTAQYLAQEFLPELERLRQASGVRQLISSVISPIDQSSTESGATLKEQLIQLLEIEPAERLPHLRALRDRYPSANNVALALAETLASLNPELALNAYQSITPTTEEEHEQLQVLQAELLLKNKRYQETLDLLQSDTEQISPTLVGLQGAALYYIGQRQTARSLLESAWERGDRHITALLPLARLWATEGNEQKAAEVYEILREVDRDCLTFEDYALIAIVTDYGGFGDITDEEKLACYEACLTHAGNQIASLPLAKELLCNRLELCHRLPSTEKLQEAYADWLEWIARHKPLAELDSELTKLRSLIQTQRLNRRQYFELLETLEPYVDFLTGLRNCLLNDYQAIALAEIDDALRQSRPESPFFQDLKRAIFLIDAAIAREIEVYRQEKRDDAIKLNIQVPQELEITSPTLNLSDLYLALVGGHEATRREVIRTLQENYSLERISEVAPSSEAYLDRNSVKAKIEHCSLIVLITGYMGHDLSNLINDLKRDNALQGEVLLLPCRGKSGVVREIISWYKKMQA